MKALALAAIRFYQRALSPYKGFCCAYCAHTGRASCSALGYRAIRRYGLGHGLRILNGRLDKCGIAHRRYGPRRPAIYKQAGFCDAPCDGPCDLPCDGPGVDSAGSALLDCADCSFSRRDRERKRRKNRDETDVHLPPRQPRRPDST